MRTVEKRHFAAQPDGPSRPASIAAAAFFCFALAGCHGAERALTPGTAEEAGMDAARLAAAVELIHKAVEADRLRGAVTLAARKGIVVHHQAHGWRDVEKKKPMRKDSLFRMASNTKTFTATAIQQLAEEGKLGLDDPVHQYIPSFGNPRSRRITIRHLLTHTSGLRIKPLFLKPLMSPSAEHPDAPTLTLEAARFGHVGAEQEPGATFSYNNPGYNTLAALVEIASGQPFKDYLRRRVYKPLGMKDSCNHEPDADHSRMSAIFKSKKDGQWRVGWKPGDGPDYPFPRGSGGMISTAFDFAVYCQTLLNGGVGNGRRILSASSVVEAVNPQSEIIPAAKDYGFGWRVSEFAGVYSHGGSDGTWAAVDPEKGLIVLVFTQSPGGKEDNPKEEFFRLAQEACR